MRNIPTTLILIVCVQIAFAQSNKFQTAYNQVTEYDMGERKNSDPLLGALEAINETAKHETASLKGKTWYYKGYINHLIFENPEISSMHPDALFDASEAYQKAFSIEDKKFRFEDETAKNINVISAQFYKQGFDLFNMEDYGNAYPHFMEVIELKDFMDSKGIEHEITLDTGSLYMAGVAMYNVQNYEKSIEHFEKLVTMNYDNASMYRLLSELYVKVRDDIPKAEALLKDAIEAHPDNVDLIIAELNIYIATDRETEAIDKMKKAIELAPDNEQLYFVLGTTYADMKDMEQAKINYEKTIELNPEYYDAYNNLGSMYLDKANEYIELMSKPELSDSKYNEYQKKREAYLTQALPFLEKANELSPNNMSVLVVLKEIYAKLGQYDKSKQIKQQIETLKQ